MYDEYCGSCVSSMALKEDKQKCITGMLSSLSDKISILQWKKSCFREKEFYCFKKFAVFNILFVTVFQFE
jgi:hypothetical protein